MHTCLMRASLLAMLHIDLHALSPSSLVRHYLDFLLVCVVALCTLENDLLHTLYLALALYFFRRRVALRAERNRCE